MRLVFLGSPPFAVPVLERLVASPYRPALVVTPPERPRGRGRRVESSPVAELATSAGIPLEQPASVRAPELVERLRAEEADLFLVVSYGELLRSEFLALPRVACLNVHPSLLPRHRGATPVQAAILAGDAETGVSIQRVVLELDAGDVLAQRATPVRAGETAGELAERLAALSGELAVDALRSIDEGSAVFTPQDPARVTFCRRLSKDDGEIDWTVPAEALERHVRAMNPWPGARTTLPGGEPLGVWRARVAADVAGASDPSGAPGTVLDASGRLVVACGAGALELERVQAAGKRALDAAEWLRGARLERGARLGSA